MVKVFTTDITDITDDEFDELVGCRVVRGACGLRGTKLKSRIRVTVADFGHAGACSYRVGFPFVLRWVGLGNHNCGFDWILWKGFWMTSDSLCSLRYFLLDMDGTIYLGKNAIEGAAEFVGYLRDSGRGLLFFTNNPGSQTRLSF